MTEMEKECHSGVAFAGIIMVKGDYCSVYVMDHVYDQPYQSDCNSKVDNRIV
jgi:hypothetical protein